MAFSSAGNELDAVRTQREINLKTKEYKQFCSDNGLTPQTERTNVDGYKRIATSNMFKESSLRTKNSQGDFGVNWEIVKSKEYTKRFQILSENEKANDLAVQRSRNALANRDGKNTEEIYAISLTSGKDISKITDQQYSFGVERTDKFMSDIMRAEKMKEKILFIHNHPTSRPPSIADINELLSHQSAVGIIVGHNGSLYFYTKPNRRITKFDLTVAIRKTKEYNGIVGEEKTIEELAKQFDFKFLKM